MKLSPLLIAASFILAPALSQAAPKRASLQQTLPAPNVFVRNLLDKYKFLVLGGCDKGLFSGTITGSEEGASAVNAPIIEANGVPDKRDPNMESIDIKIKGGQALSNLQYNEFWRQATRIVQHLSNNHCTAASILTGHFQNSLNTGANHTGPR